MVEGYEIPNVSLEGNNSAFKAGEEKYVIFGEKIEGNQSQMMWDVFERLIQKYPDSIDKCTELTSVARVEDVENPGTRDAKPIYFRMTKKFSVNGKEYYVGTSYGKKDKLVQIQKMLKICNAPDDAFSVEGEELTNNISSTRTRASKVYDI